MKRMICHVLLMAMVITAACKKNDAVADAATDATPVAITAIDAAPPPPPTPEQLLEDHRREMSKAAEDGHYADVCTGTPWFNKSICTWVAARADGKSVDRPDSGTFRGIYYSEHWNHAYGNLLDDHADQDGRYEVTAGGYKNHCLLVTADTKYTTKGAWNLWVQEQPETEEVTTNSGAKAHWVVLEEIPLAKALMDLSHSGVSVESTANAKDAMVMIAEYKPYTERKGQLPTLPSAAPAGSGTNSAAPTTSTAAPPTGSSDMAACCAALDQALQTADPTQLNGYSALSVGCNANSPAPAAARKKQLRDNAATLKLPALPAACQ